MTRDDDLWADYMSDPLDFMDPLEYFEEGPALRREQWYQMPTYPLDEEGALAYGSVLDCDADDVLRWLRSQQRAWDLPLGIRGVTEELTREPKGWYIMWLYDLLPPGQGPPSSEPLTASGGEVMIAFSISPWIMLGGREHPSFLRLSAYYADVVSVRELVERYARLVADVVANYSVSDDQRALAASWRLAVERAAQALPHASTPDPDLLPRIARDLRGVFGGPIATESIPQALPAGEHSAAGEAETECKPDWTPPKREKQLQKWRTAWGVIREMKEEERDVDDWGDDTEPTYKDYQDRLAEEMNWKPCTRTIQKIVAAGGKGLLD